MSDNETDAQHVEAADILEARKQFVGVVFDEKVFEVDPAKCAEFAATCGETHPKYIETDHPDFQAPPTFPCSLHPGQRLPEGFPKFRGLGMDGGKAVFPIQPIRPGKPVTGRTHVHDIYTKTGRSGRMVFIKLRMDIFDTADVLLASADTSIVIREKPAT